MFSRPMSPCSSFQSVVSNDVALTLLGATATLNHRNPQHSVCFAEVYAMHSVQISHCETSRTSSMQPNLKHMSICFVQGAIRGRLMFRQGLFSGITLGNHTVASYCGYIANIRTSESAIQAWPAFAYQIAQATSQHTQSVYWSTCFLHSLLICTGRRIENFFSSDHHDSSSSFF